MVWDPFKILRLKILRIFFYFLIRKISVSVRFFINSLIKMNNLSRITSFMRCFYAEWLICLWHFTKQVFERATIRASAYCTVSSLIEGDFYSAIIQHSRLEPFVYFFAVTQGFPSDFHFELNRVVSFFSAEFNLDMVFAPQRLACQWSATVHHHFTSNNPWDLRNSW